MDLPPFTVNLDEYDCAEQFLECLPIWRRLGALGNTCYCRSPRAKTPRPSCTPLRSRFLAARMRKFSPPRQPGKILPRENAPGPRAHCAHAASPKRAPMTNCGASARPRATPRAQTPRQSCAPLWPRPLAKRLRTYRPARQHGGILTKRRDTPCPWTYCRTPPRRSLPHDKLWCTGLSACNRTVNTCWVRPYRPPAKFFAEILLHRPTTPHRKPRFPEM